MTNRYQSRGFIEKKGKHAEKQILVARFFYPPNPPVVEIMHRRHRFFPIAFQKKENIRVCFIWFWRFLLINAQPDSSGIRKGERRKSSLSLFVLSFRINSGIFCLFINRTSPSSPEGLKTYNNIFARELNDCEKFKSVSISPGRRKKLLVFSVLFLLKYAFRKTTT